jgi:hypothetical protein
MAIGGGAGHRLVDEPLVDETPGYESSEVVRRLLRAPA